MEGQDVGIVQQSVALHLGDHLLISVYGARLFGTASNLKGMLIRHLGLQAGCNLGSHYLSYIQITQHCGRDCWGHLDPKLTHALMQLSPLCAS